MSAKHELYNTALEWVEQRPKGTSFQRD